MGETGSGEKRGSDNPYEFDPGKSFFGSDGHQATVEGTFREIADDDPAIAINSDGSIERIDPTTAQRDTGDSSGGDFNPQSGGRDPAGRATGGSQAGSTGKRKYTKRGAKEVPASLGGFEDAIFAIHLALAGICKAPELELEPDEAKKVTLALDKLASFYHVEPSETAKVWMNFAGAMTSVYAPRAIAIYKRVERDSRQRAEKVVPIRG